MSVCVFLLPFALYLDIARGGNRKRDGDMKNSCIRQRANARLAILHEDYLEICNGNMLAAMLLAILVYWTDVKIGKKEENLWVWKTHEDFQEDLMFDKPGMKPPHRTTISSALDLLKSKGFIKWRKNPALALDRTRQYFIEQEKIQAAIDALPAIVSRKSDIPMLGNRHSIEQAIGASSDDFSKVGKATMQSRKSDNALSEFQQSNVGKPTSNTNDYNTEITSSMITEREGTFVADATPALSQENVFALTEEDCAPDSDAEAETVKAATPKNVTAVTSYSTNDYTNEGDDDARPTARAQNAGRPQSDASGLLRGAAPGASALRAEAGATDGELTPSQQTTPDVLDGAAPDDGQAPDAAAMAPPSRAPSASGDHVTGVGKGKNGKGNGKPATPDELLATLSEDGRAFYHEYCSLYKVAIPVTPLLVADIGQMCEPLATWALFLHKPRVEVLRDFRAWLFKHDRKDYYKGRGVKLHDMVREFEGWQSDMQQSIPGQDSVPEEWDFANYVGNGPEAIAALLERGRELDRLGLFTDL